MTIDLAPAAVGPDEEWDDTTPFRFAAAPVPSALTAAEDLAAERHHVHLVAGDVRCFGQGCIALPGV